MKLICMGDSTMQYNDETTFPQVGWPQALAELLKKEVFLMNFAKNGRVSPAVAKLTGLLGIRVVGKASNEGTLEPLHKIRGEKKAIQTLYQDMLDRNYAGGQVRICHCFNLTAAETLRELIHADFPNAPVTIDATHGLCSFYAEQGGMLVGYEDRDAQ